MLVTNFTAQQPRPQRLAIALTVFFGLVLAAVLGLQHTATAEDREPRVSLTAEAAARTADVAASLDVDVIGNPLLYGAIAQVEHWSVSAEADLEHQQAIVMLAEGAVERVQEQIRGDQNELDFVAGAARSGQLTAAVVEMRDQRPALEDRVERQMDALASAEELRIREIERLGHDLDSVIEIWTERQRILGDLAGQLARKDDRAGPDLRLPDEALAERVLSQLLAAQEVLESSPEFWSVDAEPAATTEFGAAEFEIREPESTIEQSEMRWPAIGAVNSGFGMRVHPIYRRNIMHTGIDIDAPWGDPVLAVSHGVVTEAHWKGGYGNAVVVDHGDGVTSLYSHLAEITVAPGDEVAIGGQLGLVGATGTATDAHLHFEVRVDGEAVDPLDYLP